MFIVVAVILFFCFYSTECFAKRLNKVLVRWLKDQMRETEIHSLFSKSLNTQSFENTLKNRDRIMFFCFDAKKVQVSMEFVDFHPPKNLAKNSHGRYLVLLNRNRHKQSSVIAHALKTYWIPGVFFFLCHKNQVIANLWKSTEKNPRKASLFCSLSSRIFIVAIQVFDDSCKTTEKSNPKGFFKIHFTITFDRFKRNRHTIDNNNDLNT